MQIAGQLAWYYYIIIIVWKRIVFKINYKTFNSYKL